MQIFKTKKIKFPASRFQLPDSGFTLIELLVVMFITAIIATVSLANYRAGERQKRVALTSDTIINALRTAQNYTLTGKVIPAGLTPVVGTYCSNGDNASVLFWLGIAEGNSSVNIYAANKCGGAFMIDKIDLPQQTRIKSGGIAMTACNPTCSNSNPTAINISFVPPFGHMQVNTGGSNFDFSTINVTVESTDGASSKTVTIDGVAGRIGN